jgi:glycosyltransferase involved in cell wall biosynthesis
VSQSILTYSSLYPSNAQPQHGVFVENRLRRIVTLGGVDARVVAPVPWFPFAGKRLGRYGAYAGISPAESRYGIPIDHPRYPVIPKIGMSIAPWLMYRATRAMMTQLRDDAIGFDVIDAHYFYPDGVAAAMLGQTLGRPVVISARGTDVNLISNFAAPRRQFLQAAEFAHAIIAVSDALRRRMIDIGIAAEKIIVLRNGVDAALFAPLDRQRVRRDLGITRQTMVAVGNVLESKGQDIAIRSLTHLDDTELLIVGTGSDEKKFAGLAESLGVANRVRFVGRVPHEELARYFNAADVSVLASMREGWPNVLLESLACGTPVVASNVGGVPEIITTPNVGRIMKKRTPEALADAVRDLRSQQPDRTAIRFFAEGFGWEETARAQAALYAEVAAAATPPVGSPATRRSYTGA